MSSNIYIQICIYDTELSLNRHLACTEKALKGTELALKGTELALKGTELVLNRH
jgi:hypothetical protein